MPVSLCEWRVRIGTFVHWIRDYEVRKRKERLLKERTRRVKVLCERLKAKMNDSEQETEEDDENDGNGREDGSTPKNSRCPHRTNIKSSGNFDIKDLLTSCDQCIHDLLTSSHCCSKDLLTPADECIKELLQPPDSSIKGLIAPDDCGIKALLTPFECTIKYLINSDDSVKDLITPDDCSITDLTAQDDSVKDLTTRDDSVSDHITPDDCCIKELITQDDSVKDLITPENCSVKDLTSEDFSIKDLITPDDCSVKDLIRPNDCSFKDLTSEDFSVKDLIRPDDCSVKDFITQDYSIKDLITQDYSVKDLITPDDCSIQDFIIPDDSRVSRKIFLGKNQHAEPDTFNEEQPLRTDVVFEDQTSPEDHKQVHTATGTGVEENSSSNLQNISMHSINGKRRGKEKEHGRSSSLFHGLSLKSKTGLIPEQTPPISELLLLKSGDVELNPGPHEGPGWSLELERELMSLVAEISPQYYTILCNRLGFSQAQSQSILTKNLLDVPKSLFEIICSWGLQQRDGTNHKEVLADKLRSVHLDALGRKLLEGRYLPPENSPPASTSDEGKHTSQLTQEQVNRCAQDLKKFYRTYMCKIKTDPLDFNTIFEFEKIYTNLVLLRNVAGKQIRTPLEYENLLRTKVNNELSKRIMVEGEGGAGKTTFCSKIAWDWCNGSQEFQQFEWVLLIPMRDIQDGQTVGDIVKGYLSDSNSVRPEEIDKYILAEPSKVFIIFDGLDEYRGDITTHGSDIAKILRSEKFKECTVLVTTRPWKADQIKSNQNICKPYSFIGVEGFSSDNVFSYITKYFADDENAGVELFKFMEDNEVIKENMAPFPIYVAMLCTLWRDSTSERRDMICKLKTFSQLFKQMIMFLKDHFMSKIHMVLEEKVLRAELKKLDNFLLEIGAIAFTGLLEKQLLFNEDAFSSCHEAMDACCRIGVLSRENRPVSRWKRSEQPVTSSVFFPHKLFQEYVSALYLASLYDLDNEEYSNSMRKILQNDPMEFRYLFYFTSSQANDVALDIISQLMPRCGIYYFLIDVAFEAHDATVGKMVGKSQITDGKTMSIYSDMSAHTFSGFLFIMEKCTMNTLKLRNRSCGPTVSRDIADILSSSSSLTTLHLEMTSFHENFYRLLKHVSTSKIEKSINSVQELHIDHVLINDLEKFDLSIETLFPSLKQLHLNTLQTVSPGIIQRLAHSNLSVLKMVASHYNRYHYRQYGYSIEEVYSVIPLIGEPDSLKQLFSVSFPHLTSLTFKYVVIGNIRCEAILRSLRNHTHIKVIRVIKCFTDDELDSLASEISKQKSIEITLQHDPEQNQLHLTDRGERFGVLSPGLMDALCHRTCVRKLYVKQESFNWKNSEELILDENGREVDSKIHRIDVDDLRLRDNQSVSCLLGRFISLLPCLTDLKIISCSFHDEFYKKITERASFSKIQTIGIAWSSESRHILSGQVSGLASKQLAKFLFSLPCLQDLKIEGYHLHDDFFTELSSSPAFSQIQTMEMCSKVNESLQVSAPACKQLAKFLCSLPCLNDLTIRRYHLHDDFFTELTSSPASSQIQKMFIQGHPCESLQVSALASKQLAKFLCSLPCLKDFAIVRCHLHDDFFIELSLAAFLQIQKIEIVGCKFGQVSGLASKQLAKFLCSLPCLEHLQIKGYHLHDDFYIELGSSPASSQMQTMRMWIHARESLHVSAPASKQLAKFLCSLPCLNDLQIRGNHLHDDFFTELSSSPASSQIQTMFMCSYGYELQQVSAQASKQLAKFLCSLPCLKDLFIKGYLLHDDFYIELTSSPASSQIQRIEIDNSLNFAQVSGLASKQLAKFLCSLPCLMDLTICRYHIHDDFFSELSSSPASSQNRCLREMLEEWSARRRQQLQLPPTHELEYRNGTTKWVAYDLQELAQSSSQYPSDHPGGIRSESTEIREHYQLVVAKLEIGEPHFQGFDQYLPSYLSHQIQKTSDDQALQCTSGLSSAYSRAGATSSYDVSTSLGRLHGSCTYSNSDSDDDSDDGGDDDDDYDYDEYDDSNSDDNSHSDDDGDSNSNDGSDDGDDDDDDDDAANDDAGEGAAAADRVSIAESQEHRPRKRLAETDRNPSPASSQKRCLREMLEECSAGRRQQLQLSHTHEHEHQPLSTERVASCLPYLQQSAQSSPQYPSDHQGGVRSESPQFHQFTMSAHPHERESLEGQGPNILQLEQPAQPSTGQQNNDRRNIQSDLQQANPTQQHPTGHSAGMNPMYEDNDDPDRPSTSGLSSVYSRAGATPSYDLSTSLGRICIYGDTDSDDGDDDDDEDDDDDDAAMDDAGAGAGAGAAAAAAAADRVSTAESQEHHPRKRLAKTDRNPSSPYHVNDPVATKKTKYQT